MRTFFLCWLSFSVGLLIGDADTFGPVEASGSVVENTGGGK